MLRASLPVAEGQEVVHRNAASFTAGLSATAGAKTDYTPTAEQALAVITAADSDLGALATVLRFLGLRQGGASPAVVDIDLEEPPRRLRCQKAVNTAKGVLADAEGTVEYEQAACQPGQSRP